MSRQQLLARSTSAAGLRSVFGRTDYGYPTVAHASLPDRLFSGLDEAERPSTVIVAEPEDDLTPVASPLDVLLGGGEPRPWPAESRRALCRTEALWLLTEDRHRTLDVQAVEPLAHQLSLVEHVARSPHLQRVLIADEVGLGKTIEAGLLIARLKEANGGLLRVLYLAPAALVANVMDELERLDLHPREWSAARQEARLRPNDSDPMVVASLHRAVYSVEGGTDHFATVSQSGPWDVLIVDEAHHLTDWSEDGTSPQSRLRLVQDLVDRRLAPGGRVILLSGTPHQGNQARFQNLLRLLDPSGRPAAAEGRIIYRTKDDITDWDGNPLFPIRRVHSPHTVEGGVVWRRWFTEVHRLLAPNPEDRAAAWRRATALQWCASSPQAGLAFLVRMAVRAGGGGSPRVREAALALRPYRGGSPNEPIESLLSRLGSPDDEEDAPIDLDPLLFECLQTGMELIRTDALGVKVAAVKGWLDQAPGEKFVLFAQPVETVEALVARLESILGPGSVVKISGMVSIEDRRRAQRAFREDRAVRVLVSSRAGGEGINLQVARHLVHFDVPWNPMDMEQRVGRVHRYGSVRTIEVFTIVLHGSREERVLARARARLGQIVRDIDAERFERLFARTMALVPLEELAALMVQEGFGELHADDQDRLDRLVQEGFHAWEASDRDLRDRHARLEAVERGEATHADLSWFLSNRLDARAVEGWTRQSLVVAAGASESAVREVPAEVMDLGGAWVQVSREAGIGILNPDRESTRVKRVGLNSAEFIGPVRRIVGEPENASDEVVPCRGAGLLRVERASWREWSDRHLGPEGPSEGGVLLVWVVRSLDPESGLRREVDVTWRAQICGKSGVETNLSPAAFADLLRMLRVARFPVNLPKLDAPALQASAERTETALRRTGPREPVRCVFPMAALWIDAEG